jgi:DUF1365 family protein
MTLLLSLFSLVETCQQADMQDILTVSLRRQISYLWKTTMVMVNMRWRHQKVFRKGAELVEHPTELFEATDSQNMGKFPANQTSAG